MNDFIMICTYEKDGENPELLIYKKDNLNKKALTNKRSFTIMRM